MLEGRLPFLGRKTKGNKEDPHVLPLKSKPYHVDVDLFRSFPLMNLAFGGPGFDHSPFKGTLLNGRRVFILGLSKINLGNPHDLGSPIKIINRLACTGYPFWGLRKSKRIIAPFLGV